MTDFYEFLKNAVEKAGGKVAQGAVGDERACLQIITANGAYNLNVKPTDGYFPY